ncbi:hypothetical protein AVEN_157726-1 [Araneus ventricosus]|uniref:Uncharacterized protein n=1 Tax=Araneus ventricosus TaxID=182803 RepID=A0A4Y2HB69_ARAVE|nr:hypothetical protein AVEN_157726-1 [Araneus ventricosus]
MCIGYETDRHESARVQGTHRLQKPEHFPNRSTRIGVCARNVSSAKVDYFQTGLQKSHESEVDRLKSACVQAPVGLHVSLGLPAAAYVGEAQWQFSTADRFFVGAGTCASSNCSLYTTNGMLPTGFKPVDTNPCVCKEPYTAGSHPHTGGAP